MNALQLQNALLPIFKPFSELGTNIDLGMAKSLLDESQEIIHAAMLSGVDAHSVVEPMSKLHFYSICTAEDRPIELLSMILKACPWMRSECRVSIRLCEQDLPIYRAIMDSYRANCTTEGSLDALMYKLDGVFLAEMYEEVIHQFLLNMDLLENMDLSRETMLLLCERISVVFTSCVNVSDTPNAQLAIKRITDKLVDLSTQLQYAVSVNISNFELLADTPFAGHLQTLIARSVVTNHTGNQLYDLLERAALRPPREFWLNCLLRSNTNEMKSLCLAATRLFLKEGIDIDLNDICDCLARIELKHQSLHVADLEGPLCTAAVDNGARAQDFILNYLKAYSDKGNPSRAVENLRAMNVPDHVMKTHGTSRHFLMHDLGV